MINISFSLTYFELYFLFVNILTFILYSFDKLQAISTKKNISRIPELNLLFMSLMGGTVGAIISMLIFRHKIKKLSFMIKYFAIVLLQIAIIYYFIAIYKGS